MKIHSFPRNCSQIRQKLNRYKTQIGNLEKLLSELPEVGSYPPQQREEIETSGGAREIQDLENVCTSTRFACSSNSSSRRSSPSLEPPELSPKFPTYYESSRSPSEVRNSPPILPPAYVTLTDCTDDSSDEKNRSSRRCENEMRRASSRSRKTSTFSSPRPEVIYQETIKSDADDIFNLNDDDEIISGSNLASSTCLDENHLEQALSNSSIDVMEIYEDSKCVIEAKDDPVENVEILEPFVKRSTSPILIDKTCLDTQETKPIELRIIDEARVESTDTLYEIEKTEKENREKSSKNLASHEIPNETSLNDLPICEKFPTLANWIATWSKKQSVADEPKLPEVPVVVEPPTEFQAN